MVRTLNENYKPFWSMCPERVTKNTRPSTLLSKDEGLKDIGHSMTIGNLILRANSATVSYLVRYGSLLQNKMRQILLQTATAMLLQNATEVYYKMRQVFYYKMRQFYYKERQLLQIATTLLQNATAITKRDVYDKLRQYIMQHALVLIKFVKGIFSGKLNIKNETLDNK